MTDEEIMQILARKYLKKIRKEAEKAGLGNVVDKLIKDNEEGRCVAEKKNLDLLYRSVDDDKIKYDEITYFVGYPFRKLYENDMIKKLIRKFPNKGQYSKVDAEILKYKLKK